MGLEYYFIIGGVILFVIGKIANSGPSPEEIQMQMDIINKKQQDTIDEIKSVNETRMKAASESENRDLNLDGLITISLYGSINDTIETLKTKHDPLVRLTMVYLFLEQLSPECKSNEEETMGIEVSSLASFSYDFFKQELSEEDWKYNFHDDVAGTGNFVTPVFWDGLSTGIESLYEGLNDEQKHNICAMLCSDLTSSIEDDELIQRFTDIARKKLNESGFITDSAEATFSSIEL